MTPNKQVDAATAEVIRLMRDAAARCKRVILNPPGKTDSARVFAASRAAQQLASLNRELDALSARASNVAVKGIAAAYQQGLKDAESQATKAGILPNRSPLAGDSPLVGSFNVVDRRRATVLAQQTVIDIRKSIVSMRENTGKIVRQTQAVGLDTRDVNRLLAGGTIEGKPRGTLQQLRQLIQKAAVDGQITTINAKSGVVMHFKPDDYADLVMQTKSAETATAALIERLQSRGMFYVKVIGSNSRNFCTAFVGKVFYIGPGEDPTGQFPSSRTLPRGGPPFHVRCTKRFVAFNIRMAKPEQIEAAKLEPHQREFLGLDDNAAGKLFRSQERDRRAATEPQPASDPVDEPVTVLPASSGEIGERIVGPVDLLANAKEFLQRQTRLWAAAVTPDEAASLGRYQSYGEGYRTINGYLRTGRLPEGVELATLRATISGLDSVIAKGGVPFDLPVSRAVRGTEQLLSVWRSMANTGFAWADAGYSSTSLSERGAPEFHGTARLPVMMSFIVPALTPFAYPAAVTGKTTHQLEILLGRDTRFLIQSVRQDGKIVRVEAELKRV